MLLCAGAAKPQIGTAITLDSLVITAYSDFDADDFIKKVVEDTTLYKAFKNLRYYPHNVTAKVVAFNKGGKEKGLLMREGRQHVKNRRMWTTVTSQKTNGKMYSRKGKAKYYTVTMFDKVFFPSDTVPVSNNIGNYSFDADVGTRTEKHKNNLKIMMFNPGQEIMGVPFIGKKMEIFSDDMIQYYDYRLWSHDYKDSIPCLAFTCEAKPEFKDKHTVIKDLTSYFDEETMEIMARDYRLSYYNALFNFDVSIVVEMDRVEGKLVPSVIKYTGFWDIPMNRAEIISFKIENSNYQIR